VISPLVARNFIHLLARDLTYMVDFVVWAMGTRTWRFLALPHGINYMGSEMHSPVYIFVLLLPLISPLGLEVYGFSIYSWTFFWLVTGYSQVRPRHQLADCSDHILLIQDPARRGGPCSQRRSRTTLAEEDSQRRLALRLAEEDPARRGGVGPRSQRRLRLGSTTLVVFFLYLIIISCFCFSFSLLHDLNRIRYPLQVYIHITRWNIIKFGLCFLYIDNVKYRMCFSHEHLVVFCMVVISVRLICNTSDEI
jgi:hypothetical protein